jgi:hypothetical protein
LDTQRIWLFCFFSSHSVRANPLKLPIVGLEVWKAG